MPQGHSLAPDAAAPLDVWLSYLEQLHSKEIDLGLERVAEVATRLQVLQPAPKVITVAGTNGKGSTVRYLELMLQAAGYSTGVYVSPHLYHYEERVRVNQQLLPAADHCRAFAAVEAARGDISLSYFEFGTLAAFWLFLQASLDVVILEVGLGGRLDAVNCVAADVAVLTSIGLDHCDYLGNTRELIGYEKAGIFRSGAPAVSGEPDLPHTVTEFAAAQQVPLLQVNRDYFYTVAEQSWNYQCGAVDWSGLPLPQLPLANAATALTALLQLGFELDLISVKKVLTSAQLAGRLEFRAGSPDVLLDVAHNPHAAAFLAATLNQRFPQRPIIAVVGMLRDKDYKNTLAELQPLVQHWCLATLGEPRGATAEMLAMDWPQQASTYTLHETVSDAYQAALAQAKKDSAVNPLVLVFGSFYTVGKIQPEG